jgi:hypothetical protein
MKAFLKGASLAAALLLLIIPAAFGLGGNLFLNVYVDGTPGKALVVGNVDDISGLAFLDTPDKIYEDNGQLYAVCDSLVKKDGDGWLLSFPSRGYYDEYHAVFFVSGGFDFRKINCTGGLEVLSSAHNGSIVLDVQGYALTDPAVSFSYAGY